MFSESREQWKKFETDFRQDFTKILIKIYVDTVCLYKIYDQIEEKVTGKKNEDLRFNFAPEKKLD